MARSNPLKGLGQALRAIGTCPHCGLTRFVMANSWRGHGTGVHGSAQYEATSFERVSPETHCVCVGGPVWAQIRNTEFGQGLRMYQAESVWRNQPEGERDKFVVLYNSEPGFESWMTLELEKWTQLLRENWEGIG